MADPRHDQLRMYVDGAWVEAHDGATFDTYDPATGAAIAAVPRATASDVAAAVAVPGTCGGVFGNQGEVCSAGSRVFVERSVYDEVLDALTKVAGQIRLGSGLDPDTTMGPLVSLEQQRRVEDYVDIGRREGASVAYAGDRPTDPDLSNGYFVAPTIFETSSNDLRISREEIFGPVKQSGIGRELGPYALDAYLETKQIYINLGE